MRREIVSAIVIASLLACAIGLSVFDNGGEVLTTPNKLQVVPATAVSKIRQSSITIDEQNRQPAKPNHVPNIPRDQQFTTVGPSETDQLRSNALHESIHNRFQQLKLYSVDCRQDICEIIGTFNTGNLTGATSENHLLVESAECQRLISNEGFILGSTDYHVEGGGKVIFQQTVKDKNGD